MSSRAYAAYVISNVLLLRDGSLFLFPTAAKPWTPIRNAMSIATAGTLRYSTVEWVPCQGGRGSSLDRAPRAPCAASQAETAEQREACRQPHRRVAGCLADSPASTAPQPLTGSPAARRPLHSSAPRHRRRRGLTGWAISRCAAGTVGTGTRSLATAPGNTNCFAFSRFGARPRKFAIYNVVVWIM